MDIVASSARRRSRRKKKLLVAKTLGSQLWAAIWFGDSEDLRRKAMLKQFGASNCSNWARQSRKPEGDARPVIERLTDIQIEAWSMPAGGAS